MTSEKIFQMYSEFPISEQIDVLSGFAFELTILQRECYEVGGTGFVDANLVRVLNEVQHRVTSHLRCLLRGDKKRYPDGVLLAILIEHDQPAIQMRLLSAFSNALRSTSLLVETQD